MRDLLRIIGACSCVLSLNACMTIMPMDELPRMETQEIGPGMHFIQETQPTNIGKAIVNWVAVLAAYAGDTSPDNSQGEEQ